MKLISKKVHERLLRAAERSKPKYEDRLLTARIPVSVGILIELGVPVSETAKSKWDQMIKTPPTRGTSRSVATNVLWADYYKALKAYKPEQPKAEAASK